MRLWRWRRRWPKRLLFSLLVGAIFYGLWLVGERQWTKRKADRELAKAVAEADAHDPNWRWDSLNALRKKLPDDQNSSLLIAKIKSEMSDSWGKRQNDKAWSHKVDLPPNVRYPDSVLAGARSDLDDSAEAVRLARSLKNFRNGFNEIRVGDLGVNLELRHTADTSFVVSLLGWDTRMALEEQSHLLVADNLIAILNVSRSLGDEPLFFSQLLRLYSRSVTTRLIERVLGQCNTKQELELLRLESLQSELQNDAEAPSLLAAIRGERARTDRFLEQIEKGSLEQLARTGGVDPRELWNPINRLELWEYKAMIPSDRAFLLRSFGSAIQYAQRPEHEQVPLMESLPRPPLGPGYHFSRLQLSALDLVAHTYWHETAEARCAIVGIASERFRLRHGRWPNALTELMPDFIGALPLDPYDGQPLRYTRLDDGVLVSSVGPKSDAVRKSKNRPGMPDDVQIGFRLWNPDKRRQPPPADESDPEKDPP